MTADRVLYDSLKDFHRLSRMKHASSHDEQCLQRKLNRYEKSLPKLISKPLKRLRAPGARWMRIPVGFLLILGGVFSFMPLLGLWMLPLGILLLSLDVPFLRRPTRRGLTCLEWKWRGWKRRHRR